ncbi:MAG: amino acid--tRNA ligase-related protein [Candidatus Heimdallarchaeaceae archaeon]
MVVLEKEKSSDLRDFTKRTKEIQKAFSVQHVVLFQARRILDDLGFVEVLAPTTTIEEKVNLRNEKRMSLNGTNTSYKKIHQITMFKQSLMSSFEKIYTVFPEITPESLFNGDDFDYLSDIYRLHLEMREKTIYTGIEITESFLENLFDSVKIICANFLEKAFIKFKAPTIPFPQISYLKIHKLTSSSDMSFTFGKKIPKEVITKLAKKAKKPFWIINHPESAKGILYKEDPNRAGFLLSADLILPDNFGVVATGGEREHDINKITNWLKISNKDLSQYKWYLAMMENEGKKSTGIEIGIEKLVRYILGLQNLE